MSMPKLLQPLALSSLVMTLVACSPTVQVAVPNEPITINLNVKIEHEILIKVDKEIDNLLEENSDLF
ncbi:YnbE family lipoprotein [Amphritea sp. 1_MG-2023]|uniref:YnbE family lipoprotein n=1 Tax=Amphritea sp. 1_MG-2023 TaxID=3062670 RepID=UPI0034A54BA7